MQHHVVRLACIFRVLQHPCMLDVPNTVSYDMTADASEAADIGSLLSCW